MKNIETSCYLCGCSQHKNREGIVRDDQNLKILECKNCGLIFLDSAKHITSKLYEESGMHDGDMLSIKDWQESTKVDDFRRFKMLEGLIANKNLLDFGSGSGGFLNLVKNITLRADGVELEERVRSYWGDRLKIYKELSDVDQKYDVVTAFHVVEHLSDPVSVLRLLSTKLSELGGTIIIEVPNANDALISLYNCDDFKNFTYWSKHLFYFNKATLELLINKAGMKVSSIIQYQRFPLANHMYWLRMGKPGGQSIWPDLIDSDLDDAYQRVLANKAACDTLVAYVEVGK